MPRRFEAGRLRSPVRFCGGVGGEAPTGERGAAVRGECEIDNGKRPPP